MSCYDTLLGSLRTRFWNLGAGICPDSAARALVRCAMRPGLQFIPKMLDVVEVRTLCRPVEFLHTNHFFTELALCSRALIYWKRKRPCPNCYHKVRSTHLSKMSLCAEAWRIPFIGTRKNSPGPEVHTSMKTQCPLSLWTLTVIFNSIFECEFKKLLQHENISPNCFDSRPDNKTKLTKS